MLRCVVIVLRGVAPGVVSVDEGERAPGFAHGALRVLSRVARNSVKRNFGAVRWAFDGCWLPQLVRGVTLG